MEIAVTGIVACFLSVFYGLNLFRTFPSEALQLVAAGRFAGALGVVALVVVLRDAFPLWLAYLGALAELTAFVYFVGFTVDHEQFVFRLQEFPLIALYMAWLFPSVISRMTIYPILVFTLTYSLLFGPAVGTEHQNGLLNVLSLVFFTVVGMFVGSFVKRKFKQQTEIDVLTGAYNRRALGRMGDAALAQGRRQNQPVSVALVDMDGFKQINDQFGHDRGDEALRWVSQQLQGCLRPYDRLARIGGDEFTVIVEGVNGAEDVAAVAEKLVGQVSSDLDSFHLGASIGIARLPTHGNTVEELMRAADSAMYEAKRRGKGQYRFAPD